MGLMGTVCAAAVSVLVCAPVCFGGTLIVSNRGDETVQLIDTETGETVRTIEAGAGAHEFAVSSDGRWAVGSCYGSGPGHQTPDTRLMVLDLADLESGVRMIELGDHPRPNDMRFLPDGKTVAVTAEVSQSILLVDVVAGKVLHEAHFGEKAGHMMALSPDGGTAYVPCVVSGRTLAVDLSEGADPVVVGVAETAFGAEGVDLSPDGSELWVACNRSSKVFVIDAASMGVEATIEADGFPFRVRWTPDGEWVAIAHPMSDEVRFYDASEREAVWAAPMQGGQPTSLAVSSDGRFVYAVCGASSKIAEIDLKSREVSRWFATGLMPDGLGYSKRGL